MQQHVRDWPEPMARNEVLLHNRAAGRWDLVYSYEYNSTTTEQRSGWPGSWGPIVETFQNNYQNTRWLGFLNTMLIVCNDAGKWGNWSALTASQSTIRNDGQGFSILFSDPNYSSVGEELRHGHAVRQPKHGQKTSAATPRCHHRRSPGRVRALDPTVGTRPRGSSAPSLTASCARCAATRICPRARKGADSSSSGRSCVRCRDEPAGRPACFTQPSIRGT